MVTRSRTAAELLAILEPLKERFGITRVGNVTGLDVLDVPTVMVYRPNSRLADVSQGKGLTIAEAKVSGLLEAIECWHAENAVVSLILANVEEAQSLGNIIDLDDLPKVTGRSAAELGRLLWCRGRDIVANGDIWVPFEIVNGDLSNEHPVGGGTFPFETTGLGAGNDPSEATLVSIYEVIERDAVSIFKRLLWRTGNRAIMPHSISAAPLLNDLVERIERHADVTLWDATTDLRIPVVVCEIADRAGSLDPLPTAEGFGCAASFASAALRAILEAAQGRLTHIVGVREDRFRSLYNTPVRASVENRIVGLAKAPEEHHTFSSTSDELSWLLTHLMAAGIRQVVVVPLSAPDFPISVVKVVIPGLEGSSYEYKSGQVGVVNQVRVARLLKSAT